MPNDVDHFRRRAAEERSAAERTEAGARRTHEQTAQAYERLVEQLDELARLNAPTARTGRRSLA